MFSLKTTNTEIPAIQNQGAENKCDFFPLSSHHIKGSASHNVVGISPSWSSARVFCNKS
jgi:hypothetical protein